MKSFLKYIAVPFFLIYVLALLAGVFFQNQFVFFPGKLPKGFAFNNPDHTDEVSIRTSDGEILNGIFTRGNSNMVILYFHGNAGDLSQWQALSEDFRAFNFNVLMIDYRGYGKSTGEISEDGLYEDGESAYRFLISQGFNANEIIIYGRSLGSGVATHVASKYPVRYLVLEAGYSSLKEVVEEKAFYLLPKFWFKLEFNNLEKMPRITCPLLLIHGDADNVIPVSHSKRLYDAFEGEKKLVIIAGGPHNNLNVYNDYFESIRVLAEQVMS